MTDRADNFYDDKYPPQQNQNDYVQGYVPQQEIPSQAQNAIPVDAINNPGINIDDVPLEIRDTDNTQKDMFSYLGMGFDKKQRDMNPKLNQTAYLGGQEQVSTGLQQYASLSKKAHLVAPPKALSYYQTKGEVNFFEEEVIVKGQPVEFIYYDENEKRIVLSQEAQDIIQQINGPVSFVSLIGKKNSGKTFLMNNIINCTFENKFSYSENSNLKTGFYIWNQATYNPQTNSHILFIDSFETGSFQRELHEQALFYINCLLSQTMLINIQGSLQPDSFLPLGDLLSLQNFLEIDGIEDKEELGNIFPRIVYIMNDFKHIIQEKGETIAPHTYFDNFLFSEEHFKNGNPEEQKMRRRIIKYFRNRDAFTMVSPVTETIEEEQKNVNEYKISDFSEQYQEELKTLRKKIVYHSRKKEFRGIFMSATMTCSFINSLIEDFNEQKKLNLNKAFSIMIENEFIYTFNQSILEYNRIIEEHFKVEKFKDQKELVKILREAQDKTFKVFYELKAHDVQIAQDFFQHYYGKLSDFINTKESEIIYLNDDLQREQMDALVQNTIDQTNRQINGKQRLSAQDVTSILQQYQLLYKQILTETQGDQQDGNPILKASKYVEQNISDAFNSEINNSKAEIQQQKDLQKKNQAQLDKEKNQRDTDILKLKQQVETLQRVEAELQQEKQKRKKHESELQNRNDEIKQHKANHKKLQEQLDITLGELNAEKNKKKGCF